MENKFFNEIVTESLFKSLIKNICNCKVGFYSVGLYPASLAYNCAMHSEISNILLAPRKGRKLFGAFSEEILSNMDQEIIDKISGMAFSNDKYSDNQYNTLTSLILKCEIVFLASNSNHIQDDISKAIKLKKDLNREKVVLACLVGSFCVDNNDNKPFILCEKYPELAFFTGFHRHGALRNNKDSFSANFCHPDTLTAFLGTKILNQLSPKIRVTAGVHNIEAQYVKAIKNISSIFAGFANDYHSGRPGMLPTINTVLLSQCFDQAASVSASTRVQNKLSDQFISLKELGYGSDHIIATELNKNCRQDRGDYTFSQLNAVTADVLGSMSLPTEGKPTRNFQAGQVLSKMLSKLKRCPKSIDEFIEWCNKYYLSKGDLEGLKSLKFWPHIYKKFDIDNNKCSMINIIYLCFYANDYEKKYIYKVLTDETEIIHYCQESVKPFLKGESKNMFGLNISNLQNKVKKEIYKNNINVDSVFSKESSEFKEEKYLKVIYVVNKYFKN
tara:strand:+ start:448 stop:1950 length:1503 start_codon:yes stop_codon:yes gene_type:complete